MRHAAHGATKANKRSDSLLSLFSAQHGSHAAHTVFQKSVQKSVQKSAKCVINQPLTAVSTSNGAVVELPEAVSERLGELIPQSRREIRLSRLANERRRRLVLSTSLLAIVGAVAASMSLTRMNSIDSRASEAAQLTTSTDDFNSSVSRSSQRESLDQMTEINNAVDVLEHITGNPARGTRENSSYQQATASTMSSQSDSWNLGSGSNLNVAEMSRSAADNPQVALLMDKDVRLLPNGFNPNHATGDSGNAYEFSQCTWWVYVRRHQLGLPVGSYMGNGSQWADSARGLGYWVDRTARHVGDVMVFRAGQAGSDPAYGHVAIVEKINPDGSIETSESGAPLHGRTFSRKFDAKDISQYQFIHY